MVARDFLGLFAFMRNFLKLLVLWKSMEFEVNFAVLVVRNTSLRIVFTKSRAIFPHRYEASFTLLLFKTLTLLGRTYLTSARFVIRNTLRSGMKEIKLKRREQQLSSSIVIPAFPHSENY